jgi:cell division protease FtsH
LLLEPDDGVEPLLLQAKQAQRSVLADYAGQSEYHNQGERVVAGQQLMQAVSDIFLGWQSATPPGRRSADPVRKISIIPRGQALGVTYQAPEADRYGYSETYLRGRITGTLGGRAAEEVIYGDVTTGAENDMEHASAIARQMVGRRGKSPAIGPVSVLPSSGQESSTGTDGVAPATKELIDTETRRIIGECYQQAVETLRGSRDRLDRLAHTLLDRETLDEDEAHAAAGISRDTAPATGARAAAR